MKTKTQIKHSVVPAAPIAGATAGASFTVGMDLGDRRHSVCVLDAAGRVVHRDRIANARPELRSLSQHWKGALFVMEVGVHSPWKADASTLLRDNTDQIMAPAVGG